MKNRAYVVYAKGDNFIVITGLVPGACAITGVHLQRRVPDFDYVCEANNRLWGCQYGKYKGQLQKDDGEFVNQLMACSLGDFKNW